MKLGLSAYKKSLILIMAMFLLSSCGFHLQKKAELAKPLHKLYLETNNPYGLLARSLKQNLKVSEVKLARSRNEADTVLVILGEHNAEELLSVNANQQTRQYKLTASATFEITDTQGRVILPPQTVSESRNIAIQTNLTLGGSTQATIIYKQLRAPLANAIIDRISSFEVSRIVNKAFNRQSQGQKQ